MPPYYVAAMSDDMQDEIRQKVISRLTEVGQCTSENIENAMYSKIYFLENLLDIREYVRQMEYMEGSYRETESEKRRSDCMKRRKFKMDNKIEVIGIDHGWSGMKTVHEVFISGCKEISTEPAFTENLLEFGGKYYKIGSRRLEVKDTKVTDENYYMLTLAAMAKELKIRNRKTAHVLLAVGLPLTRFGDEKKDFVSYLSKKKEVSFTFEKEKYHIFIENVCVYPQCYAAVIDRIDKFPEKQLVVDIGSWTVDIMPIINHLPDESVCVTQPHGIITCIQQINKECVRQLNAEVDEYDIQKVMVNGGGDLPEKYQEIIIKEIRGYCQQIYHNIR